MLEYIARRFGFMACFRGSWKNNSRVYTDNILQQMEQGVGAVTPMAISRQIFATHACTLSLHNLRCHAMALVRLGSRLRLFLVTIL